MGCSLRPHAICRPLSRDMPEPQVLLSTISRGQRHRRRRGRSREALSARYGVVIALHGPQEGAFTCGPRRRRRCRGRRGRYPGKQPRRARRRRTPGTARAEMTSRTELKRQHPAPAHHHFRSSRAPQEEPAKHAPEGRRRRPSGSRRPSPCSRCSQHATFGSSVNAVEPSL